MASTPLGSPETARARRSMPRRQGRGQTSVWNSAAQAEAGSGLSGSEAQDFESQQTASEEEVAEHDEVAGNSELVHEDDICPICQLLLYNPVTTTCKHTLCRFCMATWASISLTEPMAIVDVDEEPVAFDPVSELQARCPMCRTLASASLNVSRAEELKKKYPRTWAAREADGERDLVDGEDIQTVTVYIGNRHEWVAPRPDDRAQNQHRWTFFVKSSRTDIIEEVHIFLHPTFRPSRVVCQRRPYQITRLGWGVFVITASVILKAGYSWVSDDALDSPDGAPKGMLPLEWMLDFEGFNGKGSMGRCRLKVKNDRDWQDVSEEEAEDNREWTRMVRQYERDGRYEPRH
ncbi:hypothetical protein DL770_001985 [Monosporascus sp. CRB-9-2]|nr:hypothetical protein DL770_001985 [Monosporascus sp. CRB-9-2]